MSKIRLGMLALVIAPLLVHAQDVPAWPYQPEDIFAPGVEVVSIGYEYSPPVTESPAWEYIIDTEGKPRLKNIETGELSSVLPKDIDAHEVIPSPGGQWFVLVAGEFVLYSYNIITGELNDLGEIEPSPIHAKYGQLLMWTSDTEAIYRTDSSQFEYVPVLYSLDVTRPNSLKAVLTAMAQYRERPPRYEYVTTHYILSRKWDLSSHQPCTLDIYDIETQLLGNYTLGYDCGGIASPDADRYFYVAYDSDPLKPSSLAVLDIRTGQEKILFSSEIEQLESVSPDGRYVAFITDSNGKIDRAGIDPQFFDWSMTRKPKMSFYDTKKEKIVYETDLGDGNYPFRNLDWLYEAVIYETVDSGRLNKSRAAWLNRTQCILQRVYEHDSNIHYLLLEFTDTGVQETVLPEIALVLPDRRHLLIWTDGQQASTSVNLYDLVSGESQPIMNGLSAQHYSLFLSIEAGLITATFNGKTDQDADMSYTFQISP